MSGPAIGLVHPPLHFPSGGNIYDAQLLAQSRRTASPWIASVSERCSHRSSFRLRPSRRTSSEERNTVLRSTRVIAVALLLALACPAAALTWLSVGNLEVELGFIVDRLSVLMLLVVSLATCILL